MGRNFGHQQFWLTGSRFYFQRDPINGVIQPIIDFGIVDVINPTLEQTRVELEDNDGGILRLADEAVIRVNETYEVTCYNLSPEILSLVFLADPPQPLTQAATPRTGVKHYATAGKLLKILDDDYDANPTPKFTLGVASVQAVKSSDGVTTYVLDEDYEIVSLERGLIRILEGGDIATGDILIDYTPRAITGNRLIVPTAGFTTNPRGTGMIVWGRENNQHQTARLARFSITSQTPAFQIEDYSNVVLTARVLSDISLSEPAGRIEYWIGDLPDPS